jgi:DNA invertase Pin-like site-specific DNA recombinase
LNEIHNISASARGTEFPGEFLCGNPERKDCIMERIIGYARVSSDGQSVEAQCVALKAAGAVLVVAEKVSGATADRSALRKAIAQCGPGDILAVTKVDRLARSLRDLLNILGEITAKGAGFRVLDQPALDTTGPYGKLLLNVLGAMAEFEREMILARTSEGRELAKKAGVKFGRKPSLDRFQQAEAKARREAGEPLQSIARTYGVSHSTISRLAR